MGGVLDENEGSMRNGEREKHTRPRGGVRWGKARKEMGEGGALYPAVDLRGAPYIPPSWEEEVCVGMHLIYGHQDFLTGVGACRASSCVCKW